MMTWQGFLWVGIGASLGACLRAWLARYNTSLSHLTAWSWLPLGTLLANILGGLLVGMALAGFEKITLNNQTLTHLRLFLITGFLGSLTTFSSFSSEVFTLLNLGKLFESISLIGLHLMLTLLATMIGYWLIKMLIP